MEEHEPIKPSSQNQPGDSQQNIEDIGLLVVHGVGEQCQFEHLQEVAKKLALALENDSSSHRFEVYIQINKFSIGPLGAKQETWNARDGAPIVLNVRDTLLGKITRFHLQEVWWADIDPPSSLRKIIEFWFWGLSLWNTRGFIKSPILGDPEEKLILAEPISSCLYDQFRKLLASSGYQEASGRTDEQQRRRIKPHVRLEYFGIAILFIILQPILAFFNQVFHVLGSRLPIDVFSQYMSKIRLYQRRGEKGQGHLQDLNSPPRFTIRRRMIAGLVKMATSGYDRWYIMAHSLGAIVAFNALSEPEHSLVNYLDEATWNLACENNHNHLHEPEGSAKANTSEDFIKSRMKPSRPPWLKGSDRIYRHKLFKDLHGLVTYGGPFRHFVDLWPGIMLCHKGKDFYDKFEWFNIYDPSDPVASAAGEIFPTNYGGIEPIDIPYKAPNYHLLSHVSYLNSDKNSKDALVNRLLSWMRGEITDLSRSTVEESSESWRWEKKGIKRHRVFRYLIWWILGYIGALFISSFYIILLMLLEILRYLLLSSNSDFPIIFELSKILNLFNYLFSLAWGVVGLAIGLAFVMGIGRRYILGRIFGRNRAELRIKEFLEDKANSPFTFKEISNNFDYTEEVVLNSIARLIEKKVVRCENKEYVFPNYEIIMTPDASRQLQSILEDKNYQEECHRSCDRQCPESKYCSKRANLVNCLDSVLNEIKFQPNVDNSEIKIVKIREIQKEEIQKGEISISPLLLGIKAGLDNDYIWFIEYVIIHREKRYRDPMILIVKYEFHKNNTSIDSQVGVKVKELTESSQQVILQVGNLFKQADQQLENNAILLDCKPFSDFRKEECAKLERKDK